MVTGPHSAWRRERGQAKKTRPDQATPKTRPSPTTSARKNGARIRRAPPTARSARGSSSCSAPRSTPPRGPPARPGTARGSACTGALACPPSDDDIARLRRHAGQAPYGRGEETLVDADVRDAGQIAATHVELTGDDRAALEARMLAAGREDMGLNDTEPRLVPLKLLVYEPAATSPTTRTPRSAPA